MSVPLEVRKPDIRIKDGFYSHTLAILFPQGTVEGKVKVSMTIKPTNDFYDARNFVRMFV